MGTYVVIGMISGVIYGLTALGLVLIYKGSRVFNFAQAEFGTMAMYVIFFSTERGSLPYPLAIALALLSGVVFGLIVERFVARPLASAPKVIALVGTAGIALLAIGFELFRFKPEPRSVGPAIAGNGPTVLGYIVSNQKLLSLGVLVIVALGAAYFFQKTFLGMAILANSQDSFAARIVGANVNRISALTWGIAGLLGALAGVLLAPDTQFYPGFMTTAILIPAFTAAIVGGMTSLVGALVAGQIIGLVEGIGQYVIVKNPALAVVPEGTTVLIFLVLIATLLVRPNGLFGAKA